MEVGVCKLKLRLPENQSLKGKRQVVKSVIDRVSNRFNVSIAEVEDQDLWQVATLGIACVSNSGQHASQVISSVVSFITQSRLETEMLDCEVEIIPVF